ncbi:MAG TPA: ABC transporter permease [Acidimicrobiales bacterium]|nr:ABC transporter permease [Acidimicrobiales bacterium]
MSATAPEPTAAKQPASAPRSTGSAPVAISGAVPAVLAAPTLASRARAFASASLARGQVEILQFFRSKDAVVFTLALPVVLLAMLASIFSGYVEHTSVRFSQVYTTGLLAAGLASTSFLNLAVAIATERENGGLKRLAGTPMPRTAYFVGKAIVVLVTCSLEVAVLLVFGHFLYHVAFPSTLGRWWTFIWVTLLGASDMALLGIAVSSVPRTARSAAPVANLPLLVLEFISGVFVPFTALSHTLYDFAGAFPLRWVAEGYRSALLPDFFQKVEPTHRWDHGTMALVLLIWCAASLLISAKTFRWTGRGER